MKKTKKNIQKISLFSIEAHPMSVQSRCIRPGRLMRLNKVDLATQGKAILEMLQTG